MSNNGFDLKAEVEGAMGTTARELNEACNDTFIQRQTFDAGEAFRRLTALRTMLTDFEYAINKAGTKTMPSALEEKYEELKVKIREIKTEEIQLITYSRQEDNYYGKYTDNGEN